MEIGNLQEFKEQQMSKVKRRAEEKKKVQRSVSQMHAMIEAQSMETFFKECDTVGRPSDGDKAGSKDTQGEGKENRKTDIRTEMEKMLSAAGKALNLNSKVV